LAEVVRYGGRTELDSYQKAMRNRYGRLKLEALDSTTHDIQPLTLTGMFIPQSTRECAEFMPLVFELPKELQRRLPHAGELGGAERDEETLVQRVRLYEKCSELLLHQWKAQEALNADPVLRAATLDFADKRNLLLRVAHTMQTSERGLAGNLIDEHTLKRTRSWNTSALWKFRSVSRRNRR
jgi:hypothetical protein